MYGGAKIGLMGELTDLILNSGGKVIGVIPKFLKEKDVAHNGLTKLIEVNSMHERKALMEKESDGFIALPGGLGTIEEIFEMITWGQLRIYEKPCAFFNVNGYYDLIKDFLKNAVNEGFIEKEFVNMIMLESNPDTIVHRFFNYAHPDIDKAKNALKKRSTGI